MANPKSLQRPPAGERFDPTAIDATGATLGQALIAVSDGSGGQRAGYGAPSGGGAVSSVFGRTGAVVAAASDYTIAQIAGLASVAANTILAGPTSGGSAAAAMRALVAADIPSLDAAKVTTGVFNIARLATGTPDGTKFVRDDGTLAVPSGSSSVQVRKNSTGSTYTRPRINLIEGSGVTLTVADDGTDNEVDVTIAASGGGGGSSEMAPAGPKTDPNDAGGGWSWLNQGGATKAVSSRDGSIRIRAPASASNSYRARVKNAPSTPYTAIFNISGPLLALDNMSYGVMFYSTGAGKGIAVHIVIVSSSLSLFIQLGDTSHGWTGTVYHSRTLGDAPQFLALRDDGTNRRYYIGTEEENMTDVFSHGRTVDITADQIGFWANPRQTTYDQIVTLFSLKTQSGAPG